MVYPDSRNTNVYLPVDYLTAVRVDGQGHDYLK